MCCRVRDSGPSRKESHETSRPLRDECLSSDKCDRLLLDARNAHVGRRMSERPVRSQPVRRSSSTGSVPATEPDDPVQLLARRNGTDVRPADDDGLSPADCSAHDGR